MAGFILATLPVLVAEWVAGPGIAHSLFFLAGTLHPFASQERGLLPACPLAASSSALSEGDQVHSALLVLPWVPLCGLQPWEDTPRSEAPGHPPAEVTTM